MLLESMFIQILFQTWNAEICLQKMSKNEPINNDFVEVITENTSTKNNQN